MFTQKSSILVSALLATLIQSTGALSTPSKRAEAFANPADGGGSMLTDAGDGFGEPLNVRVNPSSSIFSFSISTGKSCHLSMCPFTAALTPIQGMCVEAHVFSAFYFSAF